MSRRLHTYIALIILFACIGPVSLLAYEYAAKDEKSQAFLAELDDNISKVDEAIKVINQQIDETRDAPFLPDLYLKLAELYVEKSRYLYYKKKEENQGQIIKLTDAPASIAMKNLAIQTYQGILKDFPKYRNNDKIHFFMAHEYRSLEQIDNMLNEYQIIIRKFRKSTYLGEAYVLLGDYHFDQRDLRKAKRLYGQVLKLPETKVHNMARYKLAWVYINEENNKKALSLFEAIAKSGNTYATRIEEGTSINIIREALIDSVLPYTEIKKPKGAIKYYKRLADSEKTYLRVLEKLANRYYVQSKLRDAARLYRELLRLTPDLEATPDYLTRLFAYTRKSGDISQGAEDVELLVKHMSRYLHSWRIPEKERLEAYNNFERSARDIATKLDVKARKSKRLALFQNATNAYKQYLSLFGDSKFAAQMQSNYAETLYSAGDFIKAGKEYEAIAKTKSKPKERRNLMHSAILAYFEALKNPDDLKRVELIDARRGFIAAGGQYIKAYPKAKEVPNITFSIGRSYYDLGEYDPAIKWFGAFINRYPSHKKVPEAGHLALDSYHLKKDFRGLANFGKNLVANRRIKDRKFKNEVAEIVQQSEFKAIERAAVLKTPKTKTGGTAGQFIEFAKEYRRSELGEKALYNAFVSARREDKPRLILRSGEELITQYPKSSFLKDVYPTMGNLALQSAEYEQAASYFEAYSRQFPQKRESSNLLYNAATMRRLLGDYERSAEDFRRVLKDGKRADRNDVLLQLANTYEEAEEWDKVIRYLKRLVASGRRSVSAHFRMGQAYQKLGQNKSAQAEFRKAAATYKKIRPGTRKKEEKAAAAGARFMQMEARFNSFRRLRVRKGLSEEKVVQLKSKALADLEKMAQRVSQYGSPRWTIASVYIVATAYNHFAQFLDNTAPPTGLNAAQKRQYRNLLNRQIAQYETKAKNTFAAAVAQAHKADIFDDYVKSCLEGKRVETRVRAGRSGLSGGAASKREKIRDQLLRQGRDPDALNELGILYLDAGDYRVAQLIFLRAAELGSRSYKTYNGLGVSLYHLGKHQEAYFQFKKALRMSNARSAALNLAGLYAEYGNTSKARNMSRQANRAKEVDFSSGELIPGARKLS